MLPSSQRAIPLFRLFGIGVSLDWTWFIVAYFMITTRASEYTSLTWNIAEYLALFVIVLMHEFGHALACRQVGGIADRIVLWPLGGVAFVAPPPRPGAHLWSLAAGPLVNAALFPILTGLVWLTRHTDFLGESRDARGLVSGIQLINVSLLVFNMLPIYPLDGGQILRSLLWFVIGPIRSLFVAAGIGFAGVAGLIALAIYWQSIWLGVIAFFVGSRCRQGWRLAKLMARAEMEP